MVAVVPSFIISLILLYPVYIIFRRAGLNTRLAYLVLIPFVGWLIVTVILGGSDWKLSDGSRAKQ